jgi:predicted Ser/Thr protein kinase
MIGQRIGRYQIISELGRGNMGVVYKAVQTNLHNKPVALKVLSQDLANSPTFLARFRREAAALAALQHDGLVDIRDIEEFEQKPCIVMEYVDGPSLRALLTQRGRLSPPQARDIALVLSSAVAAAHRKGIIHRDIKPDNVLLTSEGRPKLADFGIAYIQDEQNRTSHKSLPLGTPYYMAPEQAAGSPQAASDVYSLGIMLYEMLCGHVPFLGESVYSVAAKHASEPPRALGQVVPGIPDELCDVVHRALEKQPSARYKNGEELHRALRQLDLSVPAGGTLLIKQKGGASEAHRSCRQCGTRLRKDFLTCPICGLAVPRYCTRCGAQYEAQSPTCPACRAPNPALRGPASDDRAGGSRPTKPAPVDRGLDVARGWQRVKAAAEGLVPFGVTRSLATRAVHFISRCRKLVANWPPEVRDRIVWIGAGIALLAGFLLMIASLSGSDRSAGGGREFVPVVRAPPPEDAPSGKDSPPMVTVSSDDAAKPADAARETRNQAPAAGGGRKESGRTDRPPPPRDLQSGPSAATAREDIRRILRRHTQALQAGDREGLRSDMAPEVANVWQPYLDATSSGLTDISSRVSDEEITFRPPSRAILRFHLTISAVRVRDSMPMKPVDDDFGWELSHLDEHWLITHVCDGPDPVCD